MYSFRLYSWCMIGFVFFEKTVFIVSRWILSLYVCCTFMKMLKQSLNLIWNFRLQAFVFNCNWTGYRWLPCPHFGTVLDQCWGTGALTKKLAELACFVVGLLSPVIFICSIFCVCWLHLEFPARICVNLSFFTPIVWNSSLF